MTTTQRGELRVVAVRGSVTVEADDLPHVLASAIGGAQDVILDLGGLRIDPDARPEPVLDAIRASQASGAAVVVACNHGGTLRRLAMSGFNQVVPIAEDIVGAQTLVHLIRRIRSEQATGRRRPG